MVVEVDRLRAERDALVQKIDERKAASKPIVMSECAMGSQECEYTGSLLATWQIGQVAVDRWREIVCLCHLG